MKSITAVIPARDEEAAESIISNISDFPFSEAVIITGKNPSIQRNEGVKEAAGEIIYFLDDDSVVNGGSVMRALKDFEADENIAVVGGPAEYPASDTVMQKTFSLVLGSFLASGKSRARYKGTGKKRYSGEKELILCNMFVKKDVFMDMKGFREELYPNEENEFLNRLKRSGAKVLYDPDVYVNRSSRKNFIEFFRQCFSYGAGRANQMRVGFSPGDLVNTAPVFFLIYLALLPVYNPGFWWEIPLNIYLLCVLFFSAAAALKLLNAGVFLYSMLAYPVCHISYALGEIWGLVKGLFFKRKKPDTAVRVMKYGEEK
ncbi:MAG: glycosyltransferase [Candidatus Goldiibacteriota bacterium]